MTVAGAPRRRQCPGRVGIRRTARACTGAMASTGTKCRRASKELTSRFGRYPPAPRVSSRPCLATRGESLASCCLWSPRRWAVGFPTSPAGSLHRFRHLVTTGKAHPAKSIHRQSDESHAFQKRDEPGCRANSVEYRAHGHPGQVGRALSQRTLQ